MSFLADVLKGVSQASNQLPSVMQQRLLMQLQEEAKKLQAEKEAKAEKMQLFTMLSQIDPSLAGMFLEKEGSDLLGDAATTPIPATAMSPNQALQLAQDKGNAPTDVPAMEGPTTLGQKLSDRLMSIGRAKQAKENAPKVTVEGGAVVKTYPDGRTEVTPLPVAKKGFDEWKVGPDGTVFRTNLETGALERDTSVSMRPPGGGDDRQDAIDSRQVRAKTDEIIANASRMGLPATMARLKLLYEDGVVPKDVEAAATVAAEKLAFSADESKNYRNYRTVLNSVNGMLRKLESNPEIVKNLGRISGAKSAFEGWLSGKSTDKMPEDLQNFISLLGLGMDEMVRMRTGAQVNESEMKFYRDIWGNIFTDPTGIRQNLRTIAERTEQNLQAMIDSARSMQVGDYKDMDKGYETSPAYMSSDALKDKIASYENESEVPPELDAEYKRRVATGELVEEQ